MKKITPTENNANYTILKIVGHFNKTIFNKNQLIKDVSLLENISEVLES